MAKKNHAEQGKKYCVDKLSNIVVLQSQQQVVIHHPVATLHSTHHDTTEPNCRKDEIYCITVRLRPREAD